MAQKDENSFQYFNSMLKLDPPISKIPSIKVYSDFSIYACFIIFSKPKNQLTLCSLKGEMKDLLYRCTGANA